MQGGGKQNVKFGLPPAFHYPCNSKDASRTNTEESDFAVHVLRFEQATEPQTPLGNLKQHRSMQKKRTDYGKGNPLYRNVFEYNDLLGVETLHPLVSVIDLSKAHPMKHVRHIFGFYAIFLKEVKCGDLLYGRQRYDYQEGTLVCLAPGQVIGIEDNGEVYQPKGWALVFHPDLIRGTSLGRNIREYSFFSYEVNEALHLSEREREMVVGCFLKIRQELEHAIDRHSKRLIAINIEMLLDYCLRFYERQFITRSNVNHDILARFERLLDDYFAGDRAQREGLPSVKWCAGELCLSPNYFGDLIKKETGKSAQEYIQLKLIATAKERILAPNKTIGQVAYELGFQISAALHPSVQENHRPYPQRIPVGGTSGVVTACIQSKNSAATRLCSAIFIRNPENFKNRLCIRYPYIIVQNLEK